MFGIVEMSQECPVEGEYKFAKVTVHDPDSVTGGNLTEPSDVDFNSVTGSDSIRSSTVESDSAKLGNDFVEDVDKESTGIAGFSLAETLENNSNDIIGEDNVEKVGTVSTEMKEGVRFKAVETDDDVIGELVSILLRVVEVFFTMIVFDSVE